VQKYLVANDSAPSRAHDCPELGRFSVTGLLDQGAFLPTLVLGFPGPAVYRPSATKLGFLGLAAACCGTGLVGWNAGGLPSGKLESAPVEVKPALTVPKPGPTKNEST
jgi:hypothetical protein